ncbi:MAG TPA: arylesterase [Flavisolibacter sp.]|nr:arylesterase [Flavisolibacter sp.]
MNRMISKIKSFMALCFIGTLLACGNSKNENGPSARPQKTDTAASKAAANIVFFGNSLTAGYGLESPSQAFPGLIQQKIDSAGLPYKVVNAGVSGETTAGGNARIDWILRQPLSVFVLELGANDGLRGIPLEETRKNLQAMIDKVKAKYPQAGILLAGMQVPPNMGRDYSEGFRKIYPELASKNETGLVPFLLEGVGGEAALNQGDGIHPTAEGHLLLADNVWKELQKMLAR